MTASRFDRSAILKAAWVHARALAVRLGRTVRSVFAGCLRSAWFEAKHPRDTSSKLDILAGIVIQWPAKLRGTFAFRFICDNANRAEKYGDKARFSDKQIAIIDEMYIKYA